MSLRNLVLLVGAAAALSACGDDDGDGGTGIVTSARARVVHAIPDAPAVNVLVDGTQLHGGGNLAYKGVTNYVSLNGGPHNLRVDLAGNGAALLEQQATFAVGMDYTLVATGLVGSGTVTALVAPYDRAQVRSDAASIRVIHASPSAGDVDVYASTGSAPLTDLNRVEEAISFQAVTEYVTVPSGNGYRISVTPTGSTTVAIEPVVINLSAGQVRTFVIVGNGSASAPLALITLDDR